MIRSIARKEFSEILRDGRFKWTAGIMVLLLITAMLAGYQKYSGYTNVQQMAQRDSNSQWLQQGDKNPHSAAHYGNYAFKPAGPLAFFDTGISNYAGTAIFLEAHKQNFSIGRPATDQSAIGRFGDLSGAMILQLLMPLLIIFLGFTAFSGERESGTLRQVMSMGVTNHQLLWGKALGVGTAVVMVVVPCILIGGIALSMADLHIVGEGIGTRIAALSFSYLIYGGIFLFLTLAVSAWASTARTALMVLIGLWAFSGFLAPKAASEISKAIHPSPAFGSWVSDMRNHQIRGLDGEPPFVTVEKYKAELFKKYNINSIAELPVYWPATRMQKLEELDHPIFDLHFGTIKDDYTAQRRIQDRIGVVAPTLPLRSISMGLSGTDLIQHIKFLEDGEAYRRNMVAQMNGYLSKAAASMNATFSSSNYMRADEKVFGIVPPFEFDPPSLSATLREHRSNFAMLVLWFAAALTLALLAINRMTVESS
jgi:ABC-2 type transport system permease protein